MKTANTFSIIANTNSYIAQRNIAFNGKTQIVIESGLTDSEASEKLESMLQYDYQNILLCESLEEWIYNNHFSEIYTQWEPLGGDLEDYFQATKRRWVVKFGKTAKFSVVGFYDFTDYSGELIMKKGGTSYEFDSRFYSIE